MKKSISLGLLIAATACAGPAFAQNADSLSATTGVDYSSGDYGTGSNTDILVVPFSLRLKTGDLRLTASAPWLRIDGSSAIVGGDGSIIVDPNAPRTVRSGIGDVSVGAAYMISEGVLGFGLDLSARVKIPTASRSKGLGTGKADLAVKAEMSKTFGAVTPFASVGYRVLGKPTGLALRNAWSASTGASVAAGRTVFVGSYDFREATSAFSRDSHELFGAMNTPVSKALRLTLYGTAGLSKGAADYGLGAMLTYKLY